MLAIYTDGNVDITKLYQSIAGLFKTLDKKFRIQYKKTIFLLKNCKTSRHNAETTEKWMGTLRMKTAECKYKETDR